MPLVIEDGTGVAGSNSWIDLDDADAYWEERSTLAWLDATPENREGALIAAADYLMIAYRWPGQPTTMRQRLPWPRVGVRSGSGYYPSDGIPTQVVDAQRVLAIEALTTDLLRKPSADRQIIEESKSAKGFSKTLKYATPPVDSVSGLPRFPVIDVMLRGIATTGGDGSFGTVRLVKGF